MREFPWGSFERRVIDQWRELRLGHICMCECRQSGDRFSEILLTLVLPRQLLGALMTVNETMTWDEAVAFVLRHSCITGSEPLAHAMDMLGPCDMGILLPTATGRIVVVRRRAAQLLAYMESGGVQPFEQAMPDNSSQWPILLAG